ncbi:RND family efflux transporter, MFP subunit [Carboxydocella sporoproducens DSM 16521]|uniref:RND family efflux transporter, MFP subunit n=2 Tax=Carboxydocella TaxID=178898 RepID=A0A1T4P0V9_9FIRM|nr:MULTISPECIES: efflux RND transporter periplasmic adaptor subunit [Carboxydocella]AVX19594.1 RND family efflux transporter, MFP subunit [Carboxydocella thermautotrophica]SJZ85081.1 RND family efflux transporter, MFP subunit [Carboxydocella sporoproducens DSM 16521]
MFRTGLAFLLGLTLLVGAAGCGSKAKETATASEAVPVEVVTATEGPISQTITIAGKVVPKQEIALVPKVGGKVSRVAVDIGQRVKAGQVVVELDASDLKAQIAATEAAVRLQQSLQKQAEVNYQDALNNYNRIKYLYDQGGASQQQLDAARANLDRAQAAYSPAGGGSSAAQIQQAQAQLQAQRVQLANFTLTSPINGVVTARNIDPGEMASPGVPVLTIVDDSTMLVEVGLMENQINYARPGQTVEVKITATGRTYQGVIQSISPAADPRSKSYLTRIEINNADETVKGGMVAEVTLAAQEKDKALLIPKAAIVEKLGARYVYVVTGNKVDEVKIETGLSDAEKVEVLSGIKAGQKVVIAGQNLLADGTEVQIKAGGQKQ